MEKSIGITNKLALAININITSISLYYNTTVEPLLQKIICAGDQTLALSCFATDSCSSQSAGKTPPTGLGIVTIASQF
jgi:hypothetical protein